MLLHPYRRVSLRTLVRLTFFILASVALHAVMIGSSTPSAGKRTSADAGSGSHALLHATLASAHAPAVAAAESNIAAPADASSAEKQGSAETPARGLRLPPAETWYSASELDVRAEPLTDVHLAYPQELEGSGIPGKVQLVLFIDERGSVRRTKIEMSEPPELFDRAAIAGWSPVKFSPAMKDGVAVKSQKLLEITFAP